MSSEYRPVVRIAGVDVDGSLKLVYGLSKIKGVNKRLAHAISKVLNIDENIRIGYLSEDDVKKIEDALSRPLDYGIPSWMLNRRKDLETGQDLHLLGSDLILRINMDIQREKKLRSWRGIRHALGLKVRGQKTRTTGRTGRTVGVRRKKK
ncbi:MAG: 30S ribosomal protein S13 [Candidatus Odinarchaeota archaeon]|nr:30S ribosomal protein S13 [Candidatus Odinarchaeota archaeon]